MIRYLILKKRKRKGKRWDMRQILQIKKKNTIHKKKKKFKAVMRSKKILSLTLTPKTAVFHY